MKDKRGIFKRRKSGIKCNSAQHPTVTNSKQRLPLGLKTFSFLFSFVFFPAPNKVERPVRCSHVAEDSDLLHTVCTVLGSTACTHQPPGAVPWQERLVRGQEHHADSRTHWMSASLHSEQVSMTAIYCHRSIVWCLGPRAFLSSGTLLLHKFFTVRANYHLLFIVRLLFYKTRRICAGQRLS